MGALPIIQRYVTNMAEDFVTSEADFLAVQNGNVPGSLTPAPDQLYLHDGRGLAAYTHVDVLDQAYFVANLVLDAISGTDKSVLNPGHPDASGQPAAKTQGLRQLRRSGHCGHARRGRRRGAEGGLVSEVVGAPPPSPGIGRRHRPPGADWTRRHHPGQTERYRGELESGQGQLDRYGTYLLSQAFPEGSPLHPAYPTGHGTVAGACITVLKFFYNGDFILANAMVPTPDWKDLLTLPL